MKKIFLGLFVLIAVLSLTVVLVKAENQTSVALTDGVQIRTDGNNGLRWEATVTNPEEGQVYGFLFAQGELTAEQLNKDTANVVADSKHAAFVEFGTGQLGMEGPYPYPFPIGMDWQYNTGKTIFEIGPGQYGWFYPAEDGTWKFTQGMPARPFMHEAFIDIYAKVERIAKEVFG